MGGALTRRRHPRFADVFKSDFIQDSGTPLQWVIAWEVVSEREHRQCAEAAIKTMIMAKALLETTWSFAAAYLVTAADG